MSLDSHQIAKKHGMLIASEIDLLKTCSLLLPLNPVVVNIGAGFGTSSIAILEVRPDAFIFSVDIQVRLEESENLRLCGIPESRCVRILGSSWIVGIDFPMNVDMVFVDGSHKSENVSKDIHTWLRKIKSGGIMLFHDYEHRNVPGLKIVVDREMKGFEILGRQRYLIAFRI